MKLKFPSSSNILCIVSSLKNKEFTHINNENENKNKHILMILEL